MQHRVHDPGESRAYPVISGTLAGDDRVGGPADLLVDAVPDDALRYAVQAHSEDEANSRLDQYIKDQTKQLQTAHKGDAQWLQTHPNGINYNQDFLREMIHNYYRTSNQLRQSSYDDLMKRVLLPVGLLGMAQ